MVDRTVYPDKDKVPELALRQIFGRQKLPESLCLLMADKGMLLVERMAMLGDSIASVKATLKAIVGDDTKFGADAPAQELSLTLLTAVWKSLKCVLEPIELCKRQVAIASDSDVMDRLHAFFIALEHLNICDFTIAAGPL
eukprot:s10607_g1.t1